METREIKHQFLKEEILDKGYDTEAFIAYCDQDRGADIDLWSLSDLKQCVKSFQNLTINKTYSTADLIDCQCLAPSVLNSDSVKVLISKPENAASLNSSPHDLAFVLFTMPMSWKVSRKFNEFKWLHDNLTNEFPGHYVPVFNEKKEKSITADPLYVDILMKQISLFINYVVSSDLFKRSLSLVNFLQEENYEKFKKCLKQKSKKVTEARNMGTFDGKITCEYNNNQEFTIKTSQFFDSFHEALKRLEAESKKIQKIQLEMINSLENYRNIMGELGNLSKGMPTNARVMREYFGKIAESIGKISEKISQIRVNVNENIHGTIKFVKNQGGLMQEIFKEKDLAFAEVDAVKKQIAKIVAKDKPVKKDLTDKSRLLQEKAGVLNYCCRDQTDRLFSYVSRLLYEDFNTFLQNSVGSMMAIVSLCKALQESLEVSKNSL